MLKMTDLTLGNYHTLANRAITNSRISDFLKDKRYFYELHVSGERQKKQKDCFSVGSAVDTWLTMGKDAFLRKFICVSRRNLKNPPEHVVELNQAQYDMVVNLCENMERQPAYKDLADHETQKILYMEAPMGGYFSGLAGIPDWFKIDGNTCYLTDLKTALDADDYKHHWTCVKRGYYRQFALQKLIIMDTFKEVEYFVYRHLVAEKDADGINSPYTYILDNRRIEAEVDNLIDNILPMIANEKEFKAKEVRWETAVTVGGYSEEEW